MQNVSSQTYGVIEFAVCSMKVILKSRKIHKYLFTILS